MCQITDRQHYLDACQLAASFLVSVPILVDLSWRAVEGIYRKWNVERAMVSISHLITALKDTTTFEKAKHTQTMAAAKVAIRAFKDCLHEEELKRITDPIPA